jgi:hypothetical protein
MESTINGDINADNTRKNPKRVYALYEGQVYYQQADRHIVGLYKLDLVLFTEK